MLYHTSMRRDSGMLFVSGLRDTCVPGAFGALYAGGSDAGPAFYEFFAGGGLARLGLSTTFACVFANDWDAAKSSAYRTAWGDDHYRESDIWELSGADLPGQAALAWASFPCQDLSLAGGRKGLTGARSSAFWGFHTLMAQLAEENRAPRILALENVCGLLTSHQGRDFAVLVEALAALGYRVGALEIDAAHFVPQSRPRLFIVAARDFDSALAAPGPAAPFHSRAIKAAVATLPEELRSSWVWWRLPSPPIRNVSLADMLEPDASVHWHTPSETEALIALMAPLHQAKVAAMQKEGVRRVGAVFRRVRMLDGEKRQRAEVRFDGLAGCLRTPAGGSSRQILLIVEGESVRSRLLTPREAARLMGAPDDFPIPARISAGLHLFGDGVCAPAVRWLGENLLRPLAAETAPLKAAS